MSALLIILRVAASVTVVAVFALLVRWAGPDAEVAIAPVLARQRVDEITRGDGGQTACWTHHYDKTRPAEVVDAGWTIRAGREIYPFQHLRRVDLSAPGNDGIATRPEGPGQASRRCADVPDSLVSVPLRITGFVEHRAPWTGWLWTIRQETPEVDVP